MSRVLPPAFFDRPTLLVAEELLGCVLVRETPEGQRRAVITEVEAYDGPDDRASHASRGKTPRNAVMFGPAGVWYVYLCYGIHWMLNVVTGPEGYPAAVLLRGVRGIAGPARLTKAFGVDGAFDRLPAQASASLWMEEGDPVDRSTILRAPRIGVDYAGEWAAKPYRFLVPEVSRRAA